MKQITQFFWKGESPTADSQGGGGTLFEKGGPIHSLNIL